MHAYKKIIEFRAFKLPSDVFILFSSVSLGCSGQNHHTAGLPKSHPRGCRPLSPAAWGPVLAPTSAGEPPSFSEKTTCALGCSTERVSDSGSVGPNPGPDLQGESQNLLSRWQFWGEPLEGVGSAQENAQRASLQGASSPVAPHSAAPGPRPLGPSPASASPAPPGTLWAALLQERWSEKQVLTR